MPWWGRVSSAGDALRSETEPRPALCSSPGRAAQKGSGGGGSPPGGNTIRKGAGGARESEGCRASAWELGDLGCARLWVTLEELLPTPCPPTPPHRHSGSGEDLQAQLG